MNYFSFCVLTAIHINTHRTWATVLIGCALLPIAWLIVLLQFLEHLCWIHMLQQNNTQYYFLYISVTQAVI